MNGVGFLKSFDACVGHGDYPGTYGPAKLFLREINAVADMEKFIRENGKAMARSTLSEMVEAVEKKFGVRINW